jgi:hypothetical protein
MLAHIAVLMLITLVPAISTRCRRSAGWQSGGRDNVHPSQGRLKTAALLQRDCRRRKGAVRALSSGLDQGL